MATSMTGFGSAQGKNKTIALSIQVKTVNGRFLEPKFRMPKIYQGFENDLRARLGENFFRGNVEVFIHRSDVSATEKEVLVDTGLARGWLKASKKLSKDLGLKFTPSLETLIKVPDIFQFPEPDEVDPAEKELVIKIFSDAVKDCLGEKKREGEKLQQNLKDLLENIRRFVQETENKKVEIDKNLKSNLQKRLNTLAEDFKMDQERLHQEAVFLLEKSDVSEEIVRLKAHIQGFAKVLASSGSIGKKLDFMVQEMHREVNTIGSKTQALEIMTSVIEAKSNVEKIREQVQNIE